MTNFNQQSLLNRILYKLEVIGNKLPDPVTLFVIITAIIIICSAIMASLNVSVINPANGKEIKAISMLTPESLQRILSNIVKNFQTFPPLGMVLVTMLGVGVAEKTGLMETAMKRSIAKISPKLVTLLIIFLGINSNMAADAGFIVLPPLAASIYMNLGRNPLAGMFTAYASVAGAFHANIIVNMTDVLETSFTIPAAQIVFAEYAASPAMNYYFILISSVILMFVAYFVSVKIIEPRLGKYEIPAELKVDAGDFKDNPKESKGLKYAGISLLLYVALIVYLCIGDNALLRDPATQSLLSPKAPLMSGLVAIVLFAFLIPGIVFGIVTGSIKNDRSVVKMMNATMAGMGGYVVLAFMAAQFLAFFNWSNMGIIIAVKGAEFLKNAGFVDIGLILGFIVLSSFVNMFIGSASAKWAIMAPVFVPMFLLVGYDPAITQMAYRIGDSITNPISPLFPYFPIIIAFAERYMPKCGIGTIISNMLPFTISFGIFWTILLIIFMVFNLPLGPDGGIYLNI